ncbi:MAG: general secretion pathway protein GspB [Pedobacter sp.]
MSSILNALKKLEDEKSIRKPDSLKIDSEILRGDASRHFSPMGISLLAALLFVCGAGATYVFMKPDTGNIPVSALLPLGSPSSAAVVTPVAKKQQNQNIKAELPGPGKMLSNRSILKRDITTPSSAKPPKLPATVQPVQQIKHSEVKLPVVPTQKAPMSAIIRPATPVMPPSLKVNGIAFQDESTDRVAIVNGVSVSSGSIIEGAKVEDILKDRVRFSYGGEKFDVALGKSTR